MHAIYVLITAAYNILYSCSTLVCPDLTLPVSQCDLINKTALPSLLLTNSTTTIDGWKGQSKAGRGEEVKVVQAGRGCVCQEAEFLGGGGGMYLHGAPATAHPGDGWVPQSNDGLSGVVGGSASRQLNACIGVIRHQAVVCSPEQPCPLCSAVVPDGVWHGLQGTSRL